MGSINRLWKHEVLIMWLIVLVPLVLGVLVAMFWPGQPG